MLGTTWALLLLIQRVAAQWLLAAVPALVLLDSSLPRSRLQ